MTTPTLAVDGTDLRASPIRFRLDASRGLHATGPLDPSVVTRHGRPGGIVSRREVGSRIVPFSGNLVHTTVALRLAGEDALNALLMGGSKVFTYTRADASVRVLEGELRGDIDSNGYQPGLTSPVSAVRFNVLAADPTWRASSTTVVTVAAPATDYACALGTADSWPVITVDGNATPVVDPEVVVKDGGGTEVLRLIFTISLAVGETLNIDCDRGEIELLSGGPTVRIISALDAGLFPFALLRSWYDGATPPSVQFTVGTGAVTYYARYW